MSGRKHGHERIVITGLGAVTPLAVGAEASFAALIEGRSGVDAIARVTLSPAHDVRIAGEVKNFDPTRALDPKTAKRSSRTMQLAAAATAEALESSGLAGAGYAPERIGVVLGVAFGGMETCFDNTVSLIDRGPERVSPFAITMISPNMAPYLAAKLAGARGPTFAVASACASGNHAIGESLAMLRRGEVDAMLAGGTDACVHPLTIAMFSRMQALSKRVCEPHEASAPFDARRDGFVLSEGAAVLVLEREEAARKRGATIIAELCGYASSSEGFDVALPEPDGRGMSEAIARSLADADIDLRDVDHVNAHGTSTWANDRAETLALQKVFGGRADHLWISATKGATGHALGAAGAIEAVFTAQSLRDRIAPPTLNLRERDPACGLDYVPLEARRDTSRMDVAISNSFAFGGQNAVLVMRRYA